MLFIVFRNTWLGNVRLLMIYLIVNIIRDRVQPIYYYYKYRRRCPVKEVL